MPERYEIRGQDLPDGNKALSPKDIYNLNKNFSTIGLEVFGSADFVKTVKKEVDALEKKTDEIILSVEGKVGENEVVSAINLSPEEIKIQSSKISIEGLTTINDNFKVLLDGSIESKNGKFQGILETTDVDANSNIKLIRQTMVLYDPTDKTPRGIVSSAKDLVTADEGITIAMPKSAAHKTRFTVDFLNTYDDTTGSWTTTESEFMVIRNTDGTVQTYVDKQFSAPQSMKAGLMYLNEDSATTVTFPKSMVGVPAIVLTPFSNYTGKVVSAKLTAVSETGFSAIIQGTPEVGSVPFYWIALTN